MQPWVLSLHAAVHYRVMVAKDGNRSVDNSGTEFKFEPPYHRFATKDRTSNYSRWHDAAKSMNSPVQYALVITTAFLQLIHL